MNLTIAYSAAWHGIAIEAWGYPRTIVVDALVGLICLALIPFMARKPGESFTDEAAPLRARALAGVLGVMCLAWLPYQAWRELLGAAQPIAGTLFTLIFIGSAVFLLAGRAVLGDTVRMLTRIGAWIAPLLLAMYARYHLDTIAGWASFLVSAERFKSGAEIVLLVIPAVAGVVLLLLALRPWQELRPQPAAAEAF